MTQLKQLMKEQRMNRRTARSVLPLFSQLFKSSKKSNRRNSQKVFTIKEEEND